MQMVHSFVDAHRRLISFEASQSLAPPQCSRQATSTSTSTSTASSSSSSSSSSRRSWRPRDCILAAASSQVGRLLPCKPSSPLSPSSGNHLRSRTLALGKRAWACARKPRPASSPLQATFKSSGVLSSGVLSSGVERGFGSADLRALRVVSRDLVRWSPFDLSFLSFLSFLSVVLHSTTRSIAGDERKM